MEAEFDQCRAKVWHTVRYSGLERWLPTGDERGSLTDRIPGRCLRRADASGYCWQHRPEDWPKDTDRP